MLWNVWTWSPGTAVITYCSDQSMRLQLFLMCSIFCRIFHCWIIICLRDFLNFYCSFLRVTAVSYQNKSLSYALLANPSGLFSIDQATGDISLTRSVDYESDQHQYLLLVRAEENEQFSSATEVGVHLWHSVCLRVLLESFLISVQIHYGHLKDFLSLGRWGGLV